MPVEKNSMNNPTNSLNRFIIPKIKVDAPVSFKKVGIDGQMPMPDSPDDIAYYDFSLFPELGGEVGKRGNAIFSGHVDSGFDYCDYGKTPPPCQAVLWDLDKLKNGDTIKVSFGGNEFNFKVISNKRVAPEKPAWNNIFLKSKEEMITVFTCAGEFDQNIHSYKSRQVVRAERIK
jgi:sortase (surface protein transpeptidase)